MPLPATASAPSLRGGAEIEGSDVRAIARHIRDAGLAVSGYCRSSRHSGRHIGASPRSARREQPRARRCSRTRRLLLHHRGRRFACGQPRYRRRSRRRSRTAWLAFWKMARRLAGRLGDRAAPSDVRCRPLLREHTRPGPRHVRSPRIRTVEVGLRVAIDAYHVWWDPRLRKTASTRAGRGKRIAAFHICDWLVRTTDLLMDRGMMGDGVIDLSAMRREVGAAGFRGHAEIEIFSHRWWAVENEEMLRTCAERLTSIQP